MQNSPLQLEDYLLKSLRFAIIAPLTDVPAPATFDLLSIEVNAETQKRDDHPLRWRCELTVASKDEEDKNYPYTFELVYVGFFTVVKEFPSDRVEQMVRVNAPSLLYSAAREAIMYLTGRGRVPATLLPSITFLEPPSKTVTKGQLASSAGRALTSKPATRKRPGAIRATAKKK